MDENRQPISAWVDGPQFVIEKNEGLDNIFVNDAPRKIAIDGVIYILRGDKIYTIQGQEVK